MFQFIRSLWFWLSISISYVLLTIPALGLGLITALTHRNVHLGFQIVAKFWARFSLAINNIHLKIEGQYEYGAGRVYMANHQSLLDIWVLCLCLPMPFYFVAKQSLFKIPILGRVMKWAGYLPINRENAHEAYATLENVVSKIKNSGYCMILFPEGTRSNAHTMGSFKRGSINVAYKAQAPIYPVVIDGSYVPVQKGVFKIQSSTITVKLPGPILYSEFAHIPEKEFVKILEERMRQVLG
jgi:1-acyl-sn-glycerol-3-phosphate acyltransferase